MRTPAALLAVLCLLCSCRPAAAQPAIAALVLNDTAAGDAYLRIDGAEIWMPPKTLQAAGLRWTTAEEKIIDGELHVRLSSIRPPLVYRLDETAAALVVTAPPEAFAPRTLAAGATPPAVQRGDGTGVVLNYGIARRTGGAVQATGELSTRLGHVLLNAAGWRFDGATASWGRFEMMVDQPVRRRRWIASDRLAVPGIDGVQRSIAGVSVATNYATDPYFVRYAPLSMTFDTPTPATVEVHVNGQLVQRFDVEPGVLRLRDLPAPLGAGDTRVVVRDAFGRSYELRDRFYRAQRTLAPGLHEYRYAAGIDRVGDLGLTRGRPVMLAEHRYGVSRRLTLGARSAWTRSGLQAGPAFALAVPFGEVGAETTLLRHRGRLHHATAASYLYRARSFNAGVETQVTNAAFAGDDIGGAPSEYTTLWAGWSAASRLHFNLRGIRSRDDRRAGRRDQLAWTTSVGLPRGVALNGTVARSSGARRGLELALNLSVPVGDRSSLSTAYQRGETGPATARLSAQRSLPVGPGWGYRATLDSTSAAGHGALLEGEANARAVRVRVEGSQFGGRSAIGLSLAGAVVASHGGIRVSTPVSDAFAVVRVPGARGVRTFLNSQYVGRTNARGELLVPNLVSYYGNPLTLAADDFPPEFSLDRDTAFVAPSPRGGALVTFAANTTLPVTGRLELHASGTVLVPGYGELEVRDGSGLASPLDRHGGFYLEGLAAGSHPVIVRHLGRVYVCTLPIPEARQAVDIGTVVCRIDVRTAGGRP